MSLVRVNLLYMSIYGGILILTVLFLRLLLKKRLPKRTFSILWCMALLRLLVPVSVDAPFSIAAVIQNHVPTDSEDSRGNFPAVLFPGELYSGELYSGETPGAGTDAGDERSPGYHETIGGNVLDGNAEGSADRRQTGRVLPGIGFLRGLQEQSLLRKTGVAGSVICAVIFLALYLNCLRRFRTALPLEDPFAEQWLGRNRLLRKVEVRQSDRISSPLTYGVIRPVILLPSQMVQKDGHRMEYMEYILQHELVHVRRFDGAWKLAMAAALCLHWFNPLVWVMYLFMNRDLELSCDEEVLHVFGTKARKGYALTLIGMEEDRRFNTPLYSGFGKNAVEERVGEIMKYKKKKKITIGIAAALILTVGCMFATTSMAGTEPAEADQDLPGVDISAELLMDPPVGSFVAVDGGDGGVDSGTATGVDSNGGSGNVDRVDLPAEGENAHRLIYMKEGMPESEPAQLVTGPGYSILIPQEGWTAFGSDGWMSEDNNRVQLWVSHFSEEGSDYHGLDGEQIAEALQGEGYQEEDGHYYWRYEETNERVTAVELRQAGDRDFWGVFYTCPGEAEEGWGVTLRAMAQSFYPGTQGTSGGSAGEGEADARGERNGEEMKIGRWLLDTLAGASPEEGHDSILSSIAEGYEVDTECLDVIREWKESEVSVQLNTDGDHAMVSIRVVTVESEEDSNDYLTVELVREGEDWKICFMGIEK